eukprot:6178665-Pleurochrysis_carterae.AAC.1
MAQPVEGAWTRADLGDDGARRATASSAALQPISNSEALQRTPLGTLLPDLRVATISPVGIGCGLPLHGAFLLSRRCSPPKRFRLRQRALGEGDGHGVRGLRATRGFGARGKGGWGVYRRAAERERRKRERKERQTDRQPDSQGKRERAKEGGGERTRERERAKERARERESARESD